MFAFAHTMLAPFMALSLAYVGFLVTSCRAGIGIDSRREREALELGQMPTPTLLRRGGGSNVVSGPVAATVGGATGPAAGHHSA